LYNDSSITGPPAYNPAKEVSIIKQRVEIPKELQFLAPGTCYLILLMLLVIDAVTLVFHAFLFNVVIFLGAKAVEPDLTAQRV
jgi:hypothetical protein